LHNEKTMLLPFMLVIILIIGSFTVTGNTNDKNILFNRYEDMKINHSYKGEVLDQHQTVHDNVGLGVGENYGYNFSSFQQFIPTLPVLTRIELMIESIGYTMIHPYHIEIWDEFLGEPLATDSVPASQIPWNEPTWIEFDFDDISVTPGKTYYIYSYTIATNSNLFVWDGAKNNLYPLGISGTSEDGGHSWHNSSTTDTCFKTYGREGPISIGDPESGVGKISVDIINNDDTPLNDITWTIEVNGGFLNNIDIQSTGTISSIPVSDSYEISNDGFIFGLGPVDIIITAEAPLIGEISKQVSGFTLLFLVLFI
jgi:hypothetical protein